MKKTNTLVQPQVLNTYKCNVSYEYEIVDFIRSYDNMGRCIKCEAFNVCGEGFHCPCNMNQQLKLVGKKRITSLINVGTQVI